MQLDQRDLSIIQYVSRFGQLSTNHIQQLIFPSSPSHTTASRALNRLLTTASLARIERRTVGGSRGGSGQYVYQLGPQGYKMVRDGRWYPARAINYHSLAIADTYVMLYRLQLAGLLTIDGYSTEPDSHVTIGRFVLKPDLYVELRRPAGRTIRFMFEIDMGTQGQRPIVEKFLRYWGARQVASEAEWPDDLMVVFVAIDDQRAAELRWLLDKGDVEQKVIFRIRTLAELEDVLSNPSR